ncbi:MAG: flavodoxin family protein [bacterium]|nr:flavodoxin family protein [bacterium]
MTAAANRSIIALCGSPRVGGNTDLLVDACLQGAREAGLGGEKFQLNQLQIRPCQECGGCLKSGQCVIGDDMPKIYSYLRQARGLILASPIFFGSLTAQTKALIDRGQCCWVAKYLLKTPFFPQEAKIPGVFLCVGGMNRYQFFQNAQQIVKVWFTIMNIRYLSELFYPGIDQKGQIKRHPLAIQQAMRLGRYLAQIILESV